MTVNPIAALKADRAQARVNGDAMAGLCTLATVDNGEPQARILVLRDVADELALFFNATSPKARQVPQSETVTVLVYLPSLNRQYRLRATLARIPTDIVHDSWQLRPTAPKQLDWLYGQWPQGSVVESRAALLDGLATIGRTETTGALDTSVAPDSAIGYFVRARRVERLDLNQPDGVHDRRRYVLAGAGWQERVLVP